jgi:Multicopper oxidase
LRDTDWALNCHILEHEDSGMMVNAKGVEPQMSPEPPYAPPIAIQIRASTIANAPHATSTHPMTRSGRP